MTLEEQLRQAAVKSGLSLKALSDRSGVSYMSVWSFVNGTRTLTLPVAGKLADLLGLELRPKKRKAKKVGAR